MKKLKALLFALLYLAASSCIHHRGDIDITYSESDQYYSMEAYFNEGQTRDVERYMDRMIGNKSNMSFSNTRIDGSLTLDDRTTFYVKKSPGILKIKLDKGKNSDEGYQEIKSMCRGIKKVLSK